VVTTTEPANYPDTDLQEVANRHDSATAAMAKLATALDTIPLLCAEINRLRRRLASTLNDLHNLLAAARAALSANADGEQDPLYYLRDELQAQDQLPPEHRERP
jgi:FtsZ-binding cell division protein ZapB